MNIPSSVIRNVENNGRYDMAILNKMGKACCETRCAFFSSWKRKNIMPYIYIYIYIYISGRDIPAENIMEDWGMES